MMQKYGYLKSVLGSQFLILGREKLFLKSCLIRSRSISLVIQIIKKSGSIISLLNKYRDNLPNARYTPFLISFLPVIDQLERKSSSTKI